jgi:hypothetical protein
MRGIHAGVCSVHSGVYHPRVAVLLGVLGMLLPLAVLAVFALDEQFVALPLIPP